MLAVAGILQNDLAGTLGWLNTLRRASYNRSNTPVEGLREGVGLEAGVGVVVGVRVGLCLGVGLGLGVGVGVSVGVGVTVVLRGMKGNVSEVFQVGCLTVRGPFAPYAVRDQSLTLLGSLKSHSTITLTV